MPLNINKKIRDYANKTKVAPDFEKQPYNQATWSEQLETLIVGTTTTTYGAFSITNAGALAVLNDYENGGACIKCYQIVWNIDSGSYDLFFTTQSKTEPI
jgi:hypothetical protein